MYGSFANSKLQQLDPEAKILYDTYKAITKVLQESRQIRFVLIGHQNHAIFKQGKQHRRLLCHAQKKRKPHERHYHFSKTGQRSYDMVKINKSRLEDIDTLPLRHTQFLPKEGFQLIVSVLV